MELNRPATYRPETWAEIQAKFNTMSRDDLAKLAHRAGTTNSETDFVAEIIEILIKRGGFLLVELGLINNPELTNGTVFSHGGLEYVIDQSSAELLRTKDGTATLTVIGGGKSRSFSYLELIKALIESPDFDQLRPRS